MARNVCLTETLGEDPKVEVTARGVRSPRLDVPGRVGESRWIRAILLLAPQGAAGGHSLCSTLLMSGYRLLTGGRKR